MPVQYTGILDEHKAVRETCGIFDISHRGQFTVAGDSAAAWLNSMLTNDINKLNVGQGQYSVMLLSLIHICFSRASPGRRPPHGPVP